MFSKPFLLSVLLLTGISFASVCDAQKTAIYHVRNTFHVSGSGGWDYISINPATGNIYIAHSTVVSIITPDGEPAGEIPNTTGVHGVAFAPDFGKGFTSNGKLNTVTIFGIKSNTVYANIPVGDKPDAIMYDPYSKNVFVCNGKSHDLTVIDPFVGNVLHTIPLGGKPETAVSDEKGNLYVNLEDKNEIVVVNAKTFDVTAHWSLKGGQEPTGLAIDKNTMRLFAGCDKKLVVMDATNGKIVTKMPIGKGCDGVAFDPQEKIIYTANGEDGTLSVIKEIAANKYKLVENTVTKKGARTLTLDTRTHLVYLPTAELEKTKKPGQKRPDMIQGTFQVLVVGK